MKERTEQAWLDKLTIKELALYYVWVKSQIDKQTRVLARIRRHVNIRVQQQGWVVQTRK